MAYSPPASVIAATPIGFRGEPPGITSGIVGLSRFTSAGGDLPDGPPFSDFDRTAGFGVYGTVKAALNRLTKSFAAELYDDGIAVNAAAPTNPVATPGAGLLDLAKIDTEDIELITQTAFMLCTGDPKVLTGRIAHTQTFLREIG